MKRHAATFWLEPYPAGAEAHIVMGDDEGTFLAQGFIATGVVEVEVRVPPSG